MEIRFEGMRMNKMRIILILSVVVFLLIGCARVINNLLDSLAPPPSAETLVCPEPVRAEDAPVSVSFLGVASNAFEGAVKGDNSRRNGAPVTIKICFDPIPNRQGLGLEYQITEERIARNTDYTLSFEDGLDDSGFLFIDIGQKESLIKVKAIGDADHDVSDAGNFVIELLPGGNYTLAPPSQHRVDVLDPFDVEVNFTSAASRINEDNLEPDMINLIESREITPVDLPVRLRITGEVEADEYRVTGWTAVSGTTDQYDLIIPAGESSAPISIDALIDVDRGTEKLIFDIVEPTDRHSQKYSLGSLQTRHEMSIVSRRITGYEELGRFQTDFVSIDEEPLGVAIDPVGRIYISYERVVCITRWSFNPGDPSANPPVAPTLNMDGLRGQNCSALLVDEYSSNPLIQSLRAISTFNLTEGGSTRNYFFLIGFSGSDRMTFEASGYDAARPLTSDGYSRNDLLREVRGSGSLGGSSSLPVFGVNSSTREIYVAEHYANNETGDMLLFNYTINSDGRFNITENSNDNVRMDINNQIQWWQHLNSGIGPTASQRTQSFSVAALSSIEVNPYNGDIYLIEQAGNLMASRVRSDRIYTFRRDESATATPLRWRHDQTFNSDGECGTGNDQVFDATDIIVGPDGSVYVADSGNWRIQVYDVDYGTDTASPLTYRFSIGAQASDLSGGVTTSAVPPGTDPYTTCNGPGGATTGEIALAGSADPFRPRHLTIDLNTSFLYAVGYETMTGFDNAYVYVYRPMYSDP